MILTLLTLPFSVWSQVFSANNRLVDLATNNGLIFDGTKVNDLSGSAISASGDFNGDGFPDVAIGAPNADVVRGGMTLNSIGEVYVIFGGPDRNLAGFDIDNLRAENGGDGSSGFVILGEIPLGLVGTSLANIGDVNGDATDDLLIGAPNVGVTGFAGFTFGAAYIVFGKQNEPFPALLDLRVLRPANAAVDNTNSGLGVVLDGSQLSGQAGISVAGVGDVSGDDVNDLVIGNALALGGANRGLTYLVYGRSEDQPWPGLLQLTDLQSNVSDGSQGVALVSNLTGDLMGASVAAAGDFTGDGINDFLAGAPSSNLMATQGGMAILIPGQVSGPGQGFDTDLDLRNPESKEPIFFLAGAIAGDMIGSAVAGIGDINGDGRVDLAIGSRFAQSQGEDAGLVYVVFGRPENSPLAKNFSLTNLLPSAGGDGSRGFVVTGSAFEQLGGSITGIGDINGDGNTDLLIGADGLQDNGSTNGGAFVIYGRAANDPFPARITTISIIEGNGNRGFVMTGEQDSDQAGFAVASAGDINGDGSTDFLVTANLADGAVSNGGRTYLIFGAGDDATSSFKADGRLTHAWYDPARAGEGIVTEFGLRGGEPSFFAAWYTYLDGEQQWFATGVPEYSQDGLVIDTSLILTSGGLFGDAFDPALVENTTWGSLHIEISDCDALSWSYQSTDGSQSGTRDFIPALPDLLGLSGCREVSKNNKGLVFGSGLGAELSGTWWNPARAGEGIIVDIEDRGGQPTAFLSWFTYNQGIQQWLVGSTDGIDLSSNSLTDLPLVITSGGQFGAAFDPAQVINVEWGTVTLEFTSCTTAILNFDGQIPGGNTVTGQIELVRFTEGLEDFPCLP